MKVVRVLRLVRRWRALLATLWLVSLLAGLTITALVIWLLVLGIQHLS